MGRSGDGEIGRWGDREMGRSGDGEIGRWGDREMGKRLINSQGTHYGKIVIVEKNQP
ncbi:MAG: hypothetical protein F6K26_15830 [Moorea sp. SIO2I5]|nr:hypothetical protein [Moorena sp. SIO2I5]